jgi:nucleoside-diphosphate-sugar epimerase
MSRVFLAGATGVIGRRMIPLLLAEGHHVTALTRYPQRVDGLRAAGAEPVVADARDADALTVAVRDAAPDVVVHQLTDLGAADFAANSELRRVGTRHLVDAALAAGARRIVAQSVAFAYADGEAPAVEETPLRDSRAAVIELERAVQEVPEWVVLRYGLLYGPGTWFAPDGARAEDAFAERLVANADVTSFLHVDDAACAAVTALRWSSGPVNVCDDEPAPAYEWVPAFCSALGAPPPPVDRDAPREPWARGADNRHAREALGWTPRFRSWRDGFAAMGRAALR